LGDLSESQTDQIKSDLGHLFSMGHQSRNI